MTLQPLFYLKLRLLKQSRYLFLLIEHWQVNHANFSILKDGKHGVIDGRWVCGQCGKSLSSPSGLDQHIQTVHGAYILPCDHCDLKFKRKDHVRKTKSRIYDCIAESFYYVNYELSIIMSKVCQILSVMKTSSFWHFHSCFVQCLCFN